MKERERRIAAEGEWGIVEWAMLRNGRSPAWVFFQQLERRQRAKVLSLLGRLAETGLIINREKFKQLGRKAGKRGRGLWEFKSHQVRLLGDYRCGRRFVVAHGVIKKRGRLKASDIQKAVRILWEFDHRQIEEVIQ